MAVKTRAKKCCPFRHPESTLMLQAWHDCLDWAAGHKDIRERFERETKIPLDGKRKNWLAFINWFNKNVWGDDAESMR